MDLSGLPQLGASTIFDLIVIAIVGVSALLAMMRGFVHEVLSLASWIGAGIFALYAYPYARPFARDYIPIELAADAATALTLFVVSYLVISLFARILSGHVGDSSLDGLDRSLGLFFGAARGVLFVCLGFLVFELFFNKEEQPDWMRQAQTTIFIEEGAFLLKQAAPDWLFDTTAQEVQRAQEKADQTEEVYRNLLEPATKHQKSGEELEGYKNSSRQELERLIQSQGKGETAP